MRFQKIIFTSSLCFLLSFSFVFAQKQTVNHNFKIVGKTRIDKYLSTQESCSVEYDSVSPAHIIASFYNPQGNLYAKRRYLFTREKFNLEKFQFYYADKKVIADGSEFLYRKDGTLEYENIYKQGMISQKLVYGTGGYKYVLSSFTEKDILEGEYKIWHPNGVIRMTGNYKNNLKDGEFQLFDDSGKILRQGVYKEGKLISGMSVVPDVLYSNPEVFATFSYNGQNFFDYIQKKSLAINEIKSIKGAKDFKLSLVLDNTGAITDIQVAPNLDLAEISIVNQVFIQFPLFSPATIESVPVKSFLVLPMTISKDGIKECRKVDICLLPAKMPSFPGGADALRSFISDNLKYPKEARETHSQERILVRFIINEAGDVIDPIAFQGVNSYLREEALRVVKLMPRWIPGVNNGKPVKVNYTIPINFRL